MKKILGGHVEENSIQVPLLGSEEIDAKDQKVHDPKKVKVVGS